MTRVQENSFFVALDSQKAVICYHFRCEQESCLATGKYIAFRGGLEIRDNTLLGWVQDPVPVHLWLNEKVIATIDEAQLLEQPDGRLGFKRQLTVEEMTPGVKLLRAFALVESISKFDKKAM